MGRRLLPVGATSDTDGDRPRLRRLPTADLTPREVTAIRELLADAFGSGEEAFTDADWDHAIGGLHFVLDLDGEIIAHASVVEREIHIDGHPLRTGYVEAVAAAPGRQGADFGSQVMADVTAYIRKGFDLGALGTGRQGFYERLGWLTWAGPSFVRTVEGERRTPDEDGYIMVLSTPTSPPLETTSRISCDWRPADVW